MDLLSPKALIAGSLMAISSASVNTGMFFKVSSDVQENKTALAVKSTEINQIQNTQNEMKRYLKFLYDSELKRQGKEDSK